MRKYTNYEDASSEIRQKMYNEICTTCNNSKICTVKKTKQGPVWFCEDFDDYFQVKESGLYETTLQPVGIPPDEIIAGNGTKEIKGLCSNCESLPTCKFTKPNGGVWHCEEYK